MSNVTHQWFYMKKTMLSEDQIGPVTENELKNLAIAGDVNPETMIASPTRTKSQWKLLKTVPTLLQLYERGVAAKDLRSSVAH